MSGLPCPLCGGDPGPDPIPAAGGQVCVACATPPEIVAYVDAELARLDRLLANTRVSGRLHHGGVLVTRSALSWARRELGDALDNR